MPSEQPLRWTILWQAIGWLMVAYVIYVTLTPQPPSAGKILWDKIYHFAGYFGLMAWFAQLTQQFKQRLLIAVGFCLLGVLLEFGQRMGMARHFEFADMLANSLGVVAGLILFRGPLGKILHRFEIIFINKDR